MIVLGGGEVSYGRGTHAGFRSQAFRFASRDPASRLHRVDFVWLLPAEPLLLEAAHNLRILKYSR